MDSRAGNGRGAGDTKHVFLPDRRAAERFVERLAPYVALEVFDEARPVAYSRTTYLDTEDLAYLGSSEGPRTLRLRCREYAASRNERIPPVLTGICHLELEERAGSSRNRARLKAPPEVIAQLVRGHGAILGIWAQHLSVRPELSALWERLKWPTLAPRLTTWHRRASLVAHGGRIRITLDEHLSFCEPTMLGLAGEPAIPPCIVGFGPARILGIKYAGDPPGWLSRAMRSLPEAPEFSRFRMGMRLVERDDGPVFLDDDPSTPIAIGNCHHVRVAS